MRLSREDPKYPGAWHVFNKGEYKDDIILMWRAGDAAMHRCGCSPYGKAPMDDRKVGMHIRYDGRVLLLEFAIIPGQFFRPTIESDIQWHHTVSLKPMEDWEKHDTVRHALHSTMQAMRQRGIIKDRSKFYARKSSYDRTPLEVWV